MKREPPPSGEPEEIVPTGALECALMAGASSGRIACASIFRIAESQGVPVAEAGRAVQRLGIKVTGCQMGCF